MALPDAIAQSLLGLASHVEINTISESDAHDRLEQIIESLAAYSAVTDTSVNEVALANLRSVLQRLDAVAPERGRPAIDVPFDVIETYLLHGLKVKDIAKLFGIAQKYDPQKEEELRLWIEEETGMSIGESFQKGLKDGVILCELINKLQPGSVKKINLSQLNWHKLENLGNFIKAILAYGLKPNDIFEANDLFENGNMTQVQTTLLALASMAKTKGIDTKIDIGVKYADKQARHFDNEKIKAGQCVIGLQMGTNKCATQAGMTAYGTRRHLYDPKTQTDKPYDQTTISLQMGTNKGASQAGMPAPGTRRDIFDQKVALQPLDNSTISLQMGTNKVASQTGMSVYGLCRQVYDPKYCAPPTEPIINTNGSQGTGTNGSEISDSDYQAEFQEDEYRGAYHDDYSSHYNDQGIDY